MQPYPGFGCANGQLGFGQAGQVMFGDPYAQGQWNQQQGWLESGGINMFV